MAESVRLPRFDRLKPKSVRRAQTVSPSLPEKFRTRPDEDEQEDVTAMTGKDAQYSLNQSVFQMIAAAGSKVDFRRLDSDIDEEDEGEDTDDPGKKARRLLGERRRDSGSRAVHGSFTSRSDSSGFVRHRGKDRLLSSTPGLKLWGAKDQKQQQKQEASTDADKPLWRNDSADIATDEEEPESGALPEAGSLDSPISPEKLDAISQRTMTTKELGTMVEEQEREPELEPFEQYSVSYEELSRRLHEVFRLPDIEEVLAGEASHPEYSCWLLKSVLLQGYMYITNRHILFYAYMPRKEHAVLKSGHLSKRGKTNKRYSRYWFALKDGVLSYYADSSDVYFPNGNIDVQTAISASVQESKDSDPPSTDFVLVTNQRKYHFRADSAASANEWVKSLQKVIFRNHNDGDSIKIAIPLENVLDVEESPVIEFADTFKLKAVDNDETFAIDEYYFSFFSFGKDAFEIIRLLSEDSPASRIPAEQLLQPEVEPKSPKHRLGLHLGRSSSKSPSRSPNRSPSGSRLSVGTKTPVLKNAVRDTMLSPSSPGPSPRRASGEYGRSSFDMGHQSFEISRDGIKRSKSTGAVKRHSKSASTSSVDPSYAEPLSPFKLLSDSMTQSSERDQSIIGYSDVRTSSSDDGNTSASNILSRSDLFQTTTIKNLQTTTSEDEATLPRVLRRKPSTSSTNSSLDHHSAIRVLPPTRLNTQENLGRAEPSMGIDERKKSFEGNRQAAPAPGTSPTLTDIMKAGAYPLQRAAGWADWMKRRSKRMSALVATESMGYLEKVSDMWTGGKKHFNEKGELVPDESLEADAEDEDDGTNLSPAERFRQRFARPPSERLLAVYYGYLHRVLPLYGKIYVSNRSFCFRSILPGTKTRMILPLKDIENVDKEKGFRFGYSGLVITIRGHEELFFEFGSAETRDYCGSTIAKSMEGARELRESEILTVEQKEDAEAARKERDMLVGARKDLGHLDQSTERSTSSLARRISSGTPPIVFDDGHTSIVNFKPVESLRITCLTIGSRGDVQPYIALCKGLQKEGHQVKIATHAEFKDWIEGHGIEFGRVEGDPAELMRICVENGMFHVFFHERGSIKGPFRGWVDELLSSAWTACQDSDVLIESPSAMAGIHIAEALGIPYFRAFTMPWTRTRAYPHAFAVPEHKMGGAYNYFSYVMFDNVFWKAIAGQVNRWRKKELKLGSTGLDKMQPNKVPFLYNFSPQVVVPPLDYSDWIRVTGYWFLDESTANWEPPTELLEFIKKARDDQKPLVYVGFGSIVVSDPQALTQTVVDSVLKADVRCILSKGWSDRLGKKDSNVPEIPLPAEILSIKATPHDWLFKHIDAAAHHGGAGTTGASLRAGLPTIVKPFFGDQFFFGGRVEDLGVGICIKKLNVPVFSRALWEVTHSSRIICKAKALGEQIRSENGVENAIQAIYRDLEYARTLIKKPSTGGDSHEDSEESWTFVSNDDSDAETTRKAHEELKRTRLLERESTPLTL